MIIVAIKKKKLFSVNSLLDERLKLSATGFYEFFENELVFKFREEHISFNLAFDERQV